MRLLLVMALTVLSLGFFCRPVHSDSRRAYGSLAIETPIGMTPDRPQDNTPTVLGDLHLTHLIGRIGFVTAGQIQTKSGLPFDRENKWRAGLEAPIGGGFTVYSYFERRFDVPANRYMVGAKWGFSTPF